MIANGPAPTDVWLNLGASVASEVLTERGRRTNHKPPPPAPIEKFPLFLSGDFFPDFLLTTNIPKVKPNYISYRILLNHFVARQSELVNRAVDGVSALGKR